ncbi:MAG: hypothetical protein OEY49_16750 [Candidatus Heimdallarchaeota archaeon]|nr:hypothetical protein [Candidatus Heimdallarchaeota archaeon]
MSQLSYKGKNKFVDKCISILRERFGDIPDVEDALGDEFTVFIKFKNDVTSDLKFDAYKGYDIIFQTGHDDKLAYVELIA